jgi:hypothetical protein
MLRPDTTVSPGWTVVTRAIKRSTDFLFVGTAMNGHTVARGYGRDGIASGAEVTLDDGSMRMGRGRGIAMYGGLRTMFVWTDSDVAFPAPESSVFVTSLADDGTVTPMRCLDRSPRLFTALGAARTRGGFAVVWQSVAPLDSDGGRPTDNDVRLALVPD